jgi:serine/threonine protein phosphatase PrpC
VVPTPDFAVYSRAADATPPAPDTPAEMLLVASDGLWGTVSNQEAVDIVANAKSPKRGAAELVEKARQRWASRSRARHCDDITVAVAFL